MVKVLIQGIGLSGRISRPSDKYDYEDSYSGPTMDEIERAYKKIDNFLKEKGESIIPVMIKDFPFISEGFISASAAISCYAVNDLLVFNGFRPYLDGATNTVQIASRLKDEKRMNNLFEIIKENAGYRHYNNWGKYGDKKILEVEEKGLSKLVGNIPKLINS